MPPPFASPTQGHPSRVCVLVGGWYPEVTLSLKAAALARLEAGGVGPERVRVVEVPGAFELPQAALWVAQAGDAEAIVALGCVVRGETPHFDFVARACVDGLLQVALTTGVPVALGVITADTLDQARQRSGPAEGKGGNKGVEAAQAALAMLGLFEDLESRRRAP